MIEIHPLLPEQAAEARRVIYTTAHEMFYQDEPLEQTFARLEESWPIVDVLDFKHKYVDNGGVFLVLCENDRIIGTGALKKLEDGVGEIKRLWFLPEYHGQGLGFRMMQALIAAARERGYMILRLETSPQYQPRAYEFYHKVGFYDIPRYGDDPDDVGMEMVL